MKRQKVSQKISGAAKKEPRTDRIGQQAKGASKWRWHLEALLAIRDRLTEERGERYREVADRVEPFSLSMADSGSDEFGRDLALGQLSAEQDSLIEVDDAIGRIRSGTYGICELTGEPIEAARLRAIPWTRYTKEAAERLERSGTARRVRLEPASSVSQEETGSLQIEGTPADELADESDHAPEECLHETKLRPKKRPRRTKAKQKGPSS